MAGNDWPLLVPDPPGKDTKLPETLPTIRSTDEGKKTKGWEKKSNEKEEVLVADSLTNAYQQLEAKNLQPVPVGSKSLCYKGKKMKVFQDKLTMEWDLMEEAVPSRRDRVKTGENQEGKALVGPNDSARLCADAPNVQKTITMVKKRRKQKMTLKKKKMLENRSIFCGPKKAGSKINIPNIPGEPKDVPKKRKAIKPKVGVKNPQEQEPSSSQKIPRRRERKNKKEPTRKVPRTLDLSAKVIQPTFRDLLYNLFAF